MVNGLNTKKKVSFISIIIIINYCNLNIKLKAAESSRVSYSYNTNGLKLYDYKFLGMVIS